MSPHKFCNCCVASDLPGDSAVGSGFRLWGLGFRRWVLGFRV